MIQVYNTLSRRKERLNTLEPNKVKMYVCGPTTYNYIHLGNARPLVVFDIIRRYLQYKGYEVTYVQNFTDVDDKIIQRSQEEGKSAAEVAGKYIDEYFRDADALGVKRADYHPRVSDHIPDIIRVIETLVEKGYAYRIGGDVYYRVRAFERYGQLSGRSLEEMLAGARVEVDERKENPMDFALWKEAKPGEPAWESPWGLGRPGWHIECSVMAMKYLGETLDIHGGGADLVFPHHENEIAQSEAYSGRPFVRYWLHNGFITVNKEKMSKSLGNFFILREILSQYPAEVVRFYLGSTHYRSPLDFDNTKLEEAGRALARLNNTLRRLNEVVKNEEVEANDGTRDTDEGFVSRLRELKEKFEVAMDDDFNTAQAIGYLFDMAREINAYLDFWEGEGSSKAPAAIKEAYRVFTLLGGNILGFLSEDFEHKGHGISDKVIEILFEMKEEALESGSLERVERILSCLQSAGIEIEDTFSGSTWRANRPVNVSDLIEPLLSWRSEARRNKDFTTADVIRDNLKKIGVVVEDTKEGARWRIEATGKI